MIKVGDRLPEGSFRIKQDDGSAKEVTAAELFGGRTVVLVGVPGAFTSTCHNAHVPQFVANVGPIKAKGADRIVVLAVNDHHVMKVWAQSLGADGKIDFLADARGDYARALGLEVDLRDLGKRLRRFSAVVEGGVVKTLNFEPEGSRDVQATGAATILTQLS